MYIFGNQTHDKYTKKMPQKAGYLHQYLGGRMEINMKNYDMPLGLGMALAQNPAAMKAFSDMPESRKAEVINGTHTVNSKSEMKQYVENIANGRFGI